jgi:CubicO group peptidase (beta-lactamase class C family)
MAIPHGAKGETEPKTSTEWSAADLVHTTIGDYAKLLLSVMNNEKLTTQIAAERLTSTRNRSTPEQEKQVCAYEEAGAKCHVTAGMGLGWEVVKHNDVTIIDHDGSDWGVRTLVFFVPQRRIGVVILTNGDHGTEVAREIVRILYPDAVFIATL